MAPTTDRAPVNIPAVAPITPCEAMRAEIRKYGGWDHSTIEAIARAENSTCDPVNHNLTNSETHRRYDGSVICVGSYGALQVGCLHYQPGEDRNDLATNIRVAHKVWQGGGYNAWTMYKNGTYRKHL